MFTLTNIIILVVTSIISGTLNGVVGMATLALYPAMLYVGIEPITANVTITVGLLFSDASAVLSSRKELKADVPETIKVSALVTFGSLFGSIILLYSSTESFKKVVPIIILFSGILMALPKKHSSAGKVKTWVKLVSIIALAAVGVYEGYFGAGTGVLLTAVLSRITTAPYAEYNATRNMAALCADILSVIIFIFTIPIDWLVVPIIAVGLFLGGYLGPIVVRFIPSKVMQYGISIFAIIVSLYLGYQAFF
ncbi:sulfite exporter TauE/SafE family protein [Fructilactobacillus lindneri]|uniref:Probable membrane transporter protein n=1 Tax=Fructilactobacillus lindneri TaxID=53444 RepID=A0AB33BRI3_9LACO|nr:sulfite exporter TauE/SafE family protein [Fructilactobacillus lindneri]ANZ58928.1 hypothetical protein AYR59_02215 [Fructilactobacillus lindneri]POG99007.1 hypothetical protein BGL32_06145 [Fructilactobacillus lindneri]POH01499.1 hypothetical protein BGL33_05230 [Fructilactobacillus lindneri]